MYLQSFLLTTFLISQDDLTHLSSELVPLNRQELAFKPSMVVVRVIGFKI